MYIDAHAHYDDKAYDKDRVEIIQKVHSEGCDIIINAAQNVQTTEKILNLCREIPYLYGTAGIHPHHANDVKPDDIEKIRAFAQSEACVAIGEIGLDYYYDFTPRDIQKEIFRQQLKLAKELSMPVVVHDRDAHEDTLSILEDELSEQSKCLIHCFSGSKEMAEIIVKKGYYVSIGGVITFKNARKIIEALEIIPMDRILLETDCPYMTPVPFRGKRNDSGKIPLIAEKISEVKGVLLDIIYKITSESAISFYNINQNM